MFYLKNKILFFFQLLVIAINYLFNKKFSEKEVIQDLLPNEAIVFDVGSNLGSYIKLVSLCLKNKKVSFHSFEPSIKLCKQQERLSVPKNHSLIINNLAITDKVGTAKFYERSISSHSSLVDSPKMSAISKTHKTYDVETITIDSYCKENKINKIDLLKVDAEGFDFQVLKSSETLLQEKKIKLLKIEIWAEDDSVALISNYLNKFGYTLAGMTNLSYLNNRLKFYDAYYFVE